MQGVKKKKNSDVHAETQVSNLRKHKKIISLSSETITG